MAAASSAFKVKCPSCEATVTIRDPNLSGKKIDCPKCKYRFVAEAPDESAEAGTTAASSAAGGSTTATAKKTVGASKSGDSTNGAPKTKNKPLPQSDDQAGEKKKKKKKGPNTTLLIGGGIGVLAILVLVIGYFAGLFDSGSSENKDQPKDGQSQAKDGTAKGPGGPGGRPGPGGPGPGGGFGGRGPGGPGGPPFNNQGDNNPPKKETPLDLAADVTNMLPEDSQWVLKINGREFIETRVGSILFESSGDSARAFQRWMGFAGDDVEKFVCSGGVTANWFFGAIRLKKDLSIDALKAAMDLDPKPKAIQKRDMYLIKSNELFKMLSEYLSLKLAGWDLALPASSEKRAYALNLLDSRTLIIGDQAVVEKFLQGNAKRKYQTTYTPPGQSGFPSPGGMLGAPPVGGMLGAPPVGGMVGTPPVGGMIGTPPVGGMVGTPPFGGMVGTPPVGGAMVGAPPVGGKMGGPSGGGMAGTPPVGGMLGAPPVGGKFGGPSGGGMFGTPPVGGMLGVPPAGGMLGAPPFGNQGGFMGGAPRSSYTSNPSFLSVDPSLKSMVNQLEMNQNGTEQTTVLTFAIKVSDTKQLGLGKLLKKMPVGEGLLENILPKSPIIGVTVRQMDANKLNVAAAVEYPRAEDAAETARNLQNVATLLASELSRIMRVQIGTGQSRFPGGPGGPGFPGGPYGPGGPFGPNGPPISGPGGGPPLTPSGPMGPRVGSGGGPPRPGSGSGDERPRSNNGKSDTGPAQQFQGAKPPGLPSPPGGAQMGSGSGPGPGIGVPPGPGSGFPPGPGSGFPPGPGMGFPPGPGSGFPGNPGGQFTTSSFSISSSDKLLLVTLDVDWKPVYYGHISPSISSAIDMLKGEALMMTGRAHWHMVASVAKKFQAAGAIPYAAYPRATNSNRFDLPYLPEQRVSWMADMLPYLGYDTLSRKIKRDAAWNDETNLEAGSAWIPEFLNPELPEATWRAYVPSLKGRDLGATHFVGLTGIGMESGEFPDTPEYAKKLGIFGWNRQAKFADIVNGDGAANTIFMIQVPPNVQRPWIRGGGSTAQGVPLTGSIKPFVSSVGGRKGTYAVMADGSVRFISDSIDDAVFQALVTYKGGEKIENLDQIAPPEKIRTGEAVIIANPPPKVEPKVEEPPKKEEPKKEEAKKEEAKKDGDSREKEKR
jgi:hypothetical protein